MKAVLLHSALLLSEPKQPALYKLAVFNLDIQKKQIVWVEDSSPRSYQLGDCLVLEKVAGPELYTVRGMCKNRASTKRVDRNTK